MKLIFAIFPEWVLPLNWLVQFTGDTGGYALSVCRFSCSGTISDVAPLVSETQSVCKKRE